MLRTSVRCLPFLMVLITSTFLFSQNAPQRDPQALNLLAQCGAAMGAGSIQDTYAAGNMITPDPTTSGSITSQTKGASERFDFTLPNDTQTYAMNGGSSWAVRLGKQTRLPYAISAYHHPEHVPALACILDAGKSGMSFVYVGQENFKNSVVHHIRIFVPGSDQDKTDSLVSELNVFLDTQTLVVLRTERYVFDPGSYDNHSVWATYYSDYRVVGHTLMPYHVENYLDGHKVRDITFTSVQVNVGVADAQFQNPNGQSH